MDILERLEITSAGGLDSWPIASIEWEYAEAIKEIKSLRAKLEEQKNENENLVKECEAYAHIIAYSDKFPDTVFEQKIPHKFIISYKMGEEHIEFLIDETSVGNFDHDNHGWNAMCDAEQLFKNIANHCNFNIEMRDDT